MSNYDKFYKHYDAVMGDPKQKAAFLQSLIDKWNPKATTLMELACGTGAVRNILLIISMSPDWIFQKECSQSPKSACRRLLSSGRT
jgi:hypothetical protein